MQLSIIIKWMNYGAGTFSQWLVHKVCIILCLSTQPRSRPRIILMHQSMHQTTAHTNCFHVNSLTRLENKTQLKIPEWQPVTFHLPYWYSEKYYAVVYTDPKPQYFIGRVLSDSCTCSQLSKSSHCRMKFLMPNDGYWVWPKKDYISCVDSVYIFAGPLNLSGHFTFTVQQETEVEAKFKTLVKWLFLRINMQWRFIFLKWQLVFVYCSEPTFIISSSS